MGSKETIYVLLLQFVLSVLVAGTVIYLARLLNPEDYGTYIYYFTLVSIFPLFLGLGGEHVFLMMASRNTERLPELFGNALLVRFIGSIVFLVILSIFLFIYNVEYRWVIFYLAIGAMIAIFSNPFFLSYYRVVGLHIRPWIFCLLSPIVFLFLLLSIDVTTISLLKVSSFFMIGHLFTFVIFSLDIIRRVRPKFNYVLLRKHFGLGLNFSFSQAFDYGFQRMDVFLVQFILGPFYLGLYAAAQKIVTLFNIIPSSFHIVELPEFHRCSSNKIVLIERFKKLRLILMELGVLIFGVLILNSKFVVSLCYTSEYDYAFRVLQILAISSLILFINYPYYMLAEAIDKVKERLYIRMFSIIFTLTTIFILGKLIGLLGVSLAVLLGQLFFTGLLHWLTIGYNGGLKLLIKELRVVLLGGVICLCLFLIKPIFPVGILGALLNSIIYCLLFVITGLQFNVLKGFKQLLQYFDWVKLYR